MWSQQAAQWGELYSAHWSLGPPCFAVDPQSGVVGQLTLDLHAIARSSIRRSKLRAPSDDSARCALRASL